MLIRHDGKLLFFVTKKILFCHTVVLWFEKYYLLKMTEIASLAVIIKTQIKKKNKEI